MSSTPNHDTIRYFNVVGEVPTAANISKARTIPNTSHHNLPEPLSLPYNEDLPENLERDTLCVTRSAQRKGHDPLSSSRGNKWPHQQRNAPTQLLRFPHYRRWKHLENLRMAMDEAKLEGREISALIPAFVQRMQTCQQGKHRFACKVRTCPYCASRRNYASAKKYAPRIEAFLKNHQTYKLLFITIDRGIDLTSRTQASVWSVDQGV